MHTPSLLCALGVSVGMHPISLPSFPSSSSSSSSSKTADMWHSQSTSKTSASVPAFPIPDWLGTEARRHIPRVAKQWLFRRARCGSSGTICQKLNIYEQSNVRVSVTASIELIKSLLCQIVCCAVCTPLWYGMPFRGIQWMGFLPRVDVQKSAKVNEMWLTCAPKCKCWGTRECVLHFWREWCEDCWKIHWII